MRHPLTVARMGHLATALDWGTLPMLAIQSAVAGNALAGIDMRMGGAWEGMPPLSVCCPALVLGCVATRHGCQSVRVGASACSPCLLATT